MELFEAKQTFVFSVFNVKLQTDMGKTIVRRHLTTTDAQAVWGELRSVLIKETVWRSLSKISQKFLMGHDVLR